MRAADIRLGPMTRGRGGQGRLLDEAIDLDWSIKSLDLPVTLAFEGEAAPIGQSDGNRGGKDLRWPCERHDPGDYVDSHAADVAAHGLDLSGVDADPRLDPGFGQRGDDGGGASKPGDRAPKCGQETVAGRIDL
jgi:hypothetical protein